LPARYNASRFFNHLRDISGAKQYFSSGGGGHQTVMLAPLDSVDPLSAKIDFGKVTSVNAQERVISVEADGGKLENPPADW
jgi:hypothetical protein